MKICTILGGPLDGTVLAVHDDQHVVHVVVRHTPPALIDLDSTRLSEAEWNELGRALNDGSAVMLTIPVEVSESGWVLVWTEPCGRHPRGPA